MNIYVLPTEEGKPPRALIYEIQGPAEEAEGVSIPEGITASVAVGTLVTWSRDAGAWMTPEDVPVPQELGEAITEHARSLGVEW